MVLASLLHPTTAGDAINVAKALSAAVLFALAGIQGLRTRTALYIGLHTSYLMWSGLEQWLLPATQERFQEPVDWQTGLFLATTVALLTLIPATQAFRNAHPISPWVMIVGVWLYTLGSFITILAEVQLLATRTALGSAKAVVTDGIWRLSRNPNVFGDWLRYASFCIVSGRGSSFALLALVVLTNYGSLGSAEETFKNFFTRRKYNAWLGSTTSIFVPMPDEETWKMILVVTGMCCGAYLIGASIRARQYNQHTKQ